MGAQGIWVVCEAGRDGILGASLELIAKARSMSGSGTEISAILFHEPLDGTGTLGAAGASRVLLLEGGMPSASVYVHRFGSLIRAYQMVGFTPDRDYRYLEVNRFLRQLHPEIVAQSEARIAAIGGTVIRDPATDILRGNDEFSVSLVLARCQTHDSGSHRWKVRFDTSLCPDVTVAVRLDHANGGGVHAGVL